MIILSLILLLALFFVPFRKTQPHKLHKILLRFPRCSTLLLIRSVMTVARKQANGVSSGGLVEHDKMIETFGG